jgi:4-amino-4-deoxy-L-arabinose transferase-like glycosyltransferase
MKEQLQKEFDRNQVIFSSLIFLLLIISLFVNLGVYPLFLEEPRRAIIALEMIFRNDYIVPTEFGEFYCKKPPLYNWLIIGCYKVFGSYSEFVTRIPTVLSFLGMGATMFWIGRKYVSLTFGILAGLLFLVSIDIYYYFSLLAEIDVFYSFITLLSFFTLFHFYQKQQYAWLFISTYFLGALGVLTKGFPSIVFLAVSLPVFFFYNKDFKRLFTLSHLAGIVTFIVVTGIYFLVYSRSNSLLCYLQDLWSQSSERTLMQKTARTLFSHIYLFPLETLKNVLPSALFLLFCFRKDSIKKIRENKLIEFCFYIFITNVLVYWISPGTRARYVYMLYPLLTLILLYFYFINDNVKKELVFQWIIKVLLFLLLIGVLTLPFIPQFKNLPGIYLITILAFTLSAIVVGYYFKKNQYLILALCLCLVFMRFVFNFTVLPSRSMKDQQAQIEKEDAHKIAAIVKDEALYMYQGIPLSHTSVYYIERALQKVLGFNSDKKSTGFFIADEGQLQSEAYKAYYEFYSAKSKKILIKFL